MWKIEPLSFFQAVLRLRNVSGGTENGQIAQKLTRMSSCVKDDGNFPEPDTGCKNKNNGRYHTQGIREYTIDTIINSVELFN